MFRGEKEERKIGDVIRRWPVCTKKMRRLSEVVGDDNGVADPVYFFGEKTKVYNTIRVMIIYKRATKMFPVYVYVMSRSSVCRYNL